MIVPSTYNTGSRRQTSVSAWRRPDSSRSESRHLNTLLFPPIVLLRQLQNALTPTRAVSDVRPTARAT